MRPGLVAVGVGFLLLGAGAVSAFLLVPQRGVTSDDTTVVGPVTTPPGATPHAAVLTGSNTGSGTFDLHWLSSTPAIVDLYDASACPSQPTSCHLGLPMASWNGNTSGVWHLSGPVSFPLLLSWRAAGNLSASFQATAEEQWTTAPAIPMLTLLLVYGSGGALAVVGAVAVFLGLFLRGGVYRGPAPIISRSADDVDDLVRSEAPGRPPGPR